MRTFIYTFLFLLLIGCKGPITDLIAKPDASEKEISASVSAESERTLWTRLTNNFQLTVPNAKDYTHLEYYIERYSKHSFHISKLSTHASPYLFHIVKELENRNLPGELALLPMIESAYRPTAQSNKGASGLWQLGANTGKRYGLKQDHWYDGRRDIAASTTAALDYLEFLYKEFNGDWFLAFAAYNSGEGRVKQAIRKNKSLGKPTDFWSLKLPVQTQHFVPRLLALARVISTADQHGIKLLPIDDKPYFSIFNHDEQIDLNIAAALAEIDIQELKQLNPAYTKLITHPEGPHQLLLPTENLELLQSKVSTTSAVLVNLHIEHIIKRGESLSTIAQKYSSSINSIKQRNNIKNDHIIAGRKLIIPRDTLDKTYL